MARERGDCRDSRRGSKSSTRATPGTVACRTRRRRWPGRVDPTRPRFPRWSRRSRIRARAASRSSRRASWESCRARSWSAVKSEGRRSCFGVGHSHNRSVGTIGHRLRIEARTSKCENAAGPVCGNAAVARVAPAVPCKDLQLVRGFSARPFALPKKVSWHPVCHVMPDGPNGGPIAGVCPRAQRGG